MPNEFDEIIPLGQTLDLKYFIKEENKKYFDEDNIKFTKDGFNNKNNYDLYSTKGLLFDPKEKGKYKISIGDKELLINVTDIPNTKIDNFEWSGPLSDKYSVGRSAGSQGGTDDFDINQDNPVFEKDYSLKFTGSVTGSIFSGPGDGLNYYPQAGDLVHGYIRDEDGEGGALFYVGCKDNNNGFRIEPVFRDDIFRISYWDGSFNTIDIEEDIGLQSKKWYLLEVEWIEKGNDIKIASRIYDGTNPDDSILVELSGFDVNSNAIGHRGIMFENDKDNSLVIWDNFRALKGGANL